jgi:hypothetical protein
MKLSSEVDSSAEVDSDGGEIYESVLIISSLIELSSEIGFD